MIIDIEFLFVVQTNDERTSDGYNMRTNSTNEKKYNILNTNPYKDAMHLISHSL